MSEENPKPGSSTHNNDTKSSLIKTISLPAGNTKMFILPPDILKHLGLTGQLKNAIGTDKNKVCHSHAPLQKLSTTHTVVKPMRKTDGDILRPLLTSSEASDHSEIITNVDRTERMAINSENSPTIYTKLSGLKENKHDHTTKKTSHGNASKNCKLDEMQGTSALCLEKSTHLRNDSEEMKSPLPEHKGVNPIVTIKTDTVVNMKTIVDVARSNDSDVNLMNTDTSLVGFNMKVGKNFTSIQEIVLEYADGDDKLRNHENHRTEIIDQILKVTPDSTKNSGMRVENTEISSKNYLESDQAHSNEQIQKTNESPKDEAKIEHLPETSIDQIDSIARDDEHISRNVPKTSKRIRKLQNNTRTFTVPSADTNELNNLVEISISSEDNVVYRGGERNQFGKSVIKNEDTQKSLAESIDNSAKFLENDIKNKTLKTLKPQGNTKNVMDTLYGCASDTNNSTLDNNATCVISNMTPTLPKTSKQESKLRDIPENFATPKNIQNEFISISDHLTNTRSEISTSTRSSRRIRKPKKFDDYVTIESSHEMDEDIFIASTIQNTPKITSARRRSIKVTESEDKDVNNTIHEVDKSVNLDHRLKNTLDVIKPKRTFQRRNSSKQSENVDMNLNAPNVLNTIKRTPFRTYSRRKSVKSNEDHNQTSDVGNQEAGSSTVKNISNTIETTTEDEMKRESYEENILNTHLDITMKESPMLTNSEDCGVNSLQNIDGTMLTIPCKNVSKIEELLETNETVQDKQHSAESRSMDTTVIDINTNLSNAERVTSTGSTTQTDATNDLKLPERFNTKIKLNVTSRRNKIENTFFPQKFDKRNVETEPILSLESTLNPKKSPISESSGITELKIISELEPKNEPLRGEECKETFAKGTPVIFKAAEYSKCILETTDKWKATEVEYKNLEEVLENTEVAHQIVEDKLKSQEDNLEALEIESEEDTNRTIQNDVLGGQYKSEGSKNKEDLNFAEKDGTVQIAVNKIEATEFSDLKTMATRYITTRPRDISYNEASELHVEAIDKPHTSLENITVVSTISQPLNVTEKKTRNAIESDHSYASPSKLDAKNTSAPLQLIKKENKNNTSKLTRAINLSNDITQKEDANSSSSDITISKVSPKVVSSEVVALKIKIKNPNSFSDKKPMNEEYFPAIDESRSTVDFSFPKMASDDSMIHTIKPGLLQYNDKITVDDASTSKLIKVVVGHDKDESYEVPQNENIIELATPNTINENQACIDAANSLLGLSKTFIHSSLKKRMKSGSNGKNLEGVEASKGNENDNLRIKDSTIVSHIPSNNRLNDNTKNDNDEMEIEEEVVGGIISYVDDENTYSLLGKLQLNNMSFTSNENLQKPDKNTSKDELSSSILSILSSPAKNSEAGTDACNDIGESILCTTPGEVMKPENPKILSSKSKDDFSDRFNIKKPESSIGECNVSTPSSKSGSKPILESYLRTYKPCNKLAKSTNVRTAQDNIIKSKQTKKLKLTVSNICRHSQEHDMIEVGTSKDNKIVQDTEDRQDDKRTKKIRTSSKKDGDQTVEQSVSDDIRTKDLEVLKQVQIMSENNTKSEINSEENCSLASGNDATSNSLTNSERKDFTGNTGETSKFKSYTTQEPPETQIQKRVGRPKGSKNKTQEGNIYRFINVNTVGDSEELKTQVVNEEIKFATITPLPKKRGRPRRKKPNELLNDLESFTRSTDRSNMSQSFSSVIESEQIEESPNAIDNTGTNKIKRNVDVEDDLANKADSINIKKFTQIATDIAVLNHSGIDISLQNKKTKDGNDISTVGSDIENHTLSAVQKGLYFDTEMININNLDSLPTPKTDIVSKISINESFIPHITPIRKRRGRPPKKYTSLPDNETCGSSLASENVIHADEEKKSDQTNNEEDVQSPIPSLPKRTGRTRKSNVISNLEQSEVGSKKRNPKNTMKNAETGLGNIELEESDQLLIKEEVQSPVPTLTPQRRGRRRRSSVSPSTENSDREKQNVERTFESSEHNLKDSKINKTNRSDDEPSMERDADQIAIMETIGLTAVSAGTPEFKRSKRNIGSKLNVTEGKGLSDGSDYEDETEQIKTPQRGRPPNGGRGRKKGRGRRRSLMDGEYLSKTHSSAKRTRTSSDVQENEDSPKKQAQIVKCAKCSEEMLKNQWITHNLSQHNCMGWREGDDPLDFENDRKLLNRVLTTACKRKKNLTCEKCGATKRSVIGFISHMQFCGKTEDERSALLVTCTLCNRMLMPSSMEMHDRQHRLSDKQKLIDAQNVELIMSGKLSGKRKAAQRAVSKISEFTALVKNDDGPPSKKLRSSSPAFKNMVQKPQLVKKITGIVRKIWAKELSEKSAAACRQPGCDFSSSTMKGICEHYSTCNFTPRKNFLCKVCQFDTESEAAMVNHVTEMHTDRLNMEQSDFDEDDDDDDDNDDDDDDDDDSDDAACSRKHGQSKARTYYNSKGKIKNCYRMEFMTKHQIQDPKWNKPYSAVFDWTMEFELKHYQLELFTNLTPNPFKLLDTEVALEYLPALQQSMPTRRVEMKKYKDLPGMEIEWKRWNRFEGALDEGMPTFFVGGPVWATAWLPIPAPMFLRTTNIQYLAVSAHPTMESEYSIGRAYSGKNVIQIWNLGHLENKNESTTAPPKLAYGIVHKSGTIWCLQWCPSGCFEDETLYNYDKQKRRMKRMGLLAAACSDGCVHVYSMPFPEELGFFETDRNRWPIYESEPVLTLVTNSILYQNGEQNWQCTKLNWTKEGGHNTIVAGFSNGYIALWDLTTVSPLLSEKKGNTTFINAFQHFFAHGHAISAVSLVPYGGKRFLVTASLDRSHKFWDLENTSGPQSTMKRGIVGDGTWLTHWPCAINTFDDVLGLNHTNTTLIPLRDYGYKICLALATNSPVYTVSVCDYANGIAHGSLAGEIQSIFPHQLLHGMDMDRTFSKKRRLNSFVELRDFGEAGQTGAKVSSGKQEKRIKKNSKDYHYMPDTYDECKDRFGMVFCDSYSETIPKELQERTLYTEDLTTVPMERYPFTSVNKVTWNPNGWSYLWLAAGYQCGLVRLLCFKSMHADMADKLFPQHAETMLSKATMGSGEIKIAMNGDSQSDNTAIGKKNSTDSSKIY